MWRSNGAGTVYAYIPPNKVRCTDPNIVCNADYGQDLGRGTWTFTAGKWHTLYQEVTINSNPQAADGSVKIWIDNTNYNAPTYSYNRATIVSKSNVLVTHILFSTFFGGSDLSWASPKTQTTRFTDFVLADNCADIFNANIKFDNTVAACQTTPKARAEAEEEAFSSENDGQAFAVMQQEKDLYPDQMIALPQQQNQQTLQAQQREKQERDMTIAGTTLGVLIVLVVIGVVVLLLVVRRLPKVEEKV
jgi:hypothetical protein